MEFVHKTNVVHLEFILDFALRVIRTMEKMSPIHKLTYFLLKSVSRWFRSMSDSNRCLFAERFALFIYHHIQLRKEVALQNIIRAFPERSLNWHTKVLKNAYSFFVKNFIQFLSFPVDSSMTINGKENFDSTLKKGKGIILVTGHFGPWEILMDWLGRQNYPAVVVANKQRNRGADLFFRELREQSGMMHIYRKVPIEKMYQVLERGQILGLASDQDAKKRGVFVNFMGQSSSTPKGAARFYQETNAPMVFVVSHETPAGNYVVECEVIDISNKASIQEITQAYTTLLETRIRKHPEQYFWFHRRWKTKPPA